MDRKQFTLEFCRRIPHSAELGMAAEMPESERSCMRLTAGDHLLGDAARGLIHTAAVSSLLDTVCGMAAVSALPRPGPVATLDLRVDFLRPASIALDVLAEAECFRLTRRIAFIRAWAWQTDPQHPVATAHAAFVYSARRGRS